MCAALSLNDTIYSEYGNDPNVRVVTFKRYRGVAQPGVPAVYVGPINHLVRNYHQFVNLFVRVHDYHVGMPDLFGLVITGYAGMMRQRRTVNVDANHAAAAEATEAGNLNNTHGENPQRNPRRIPQINPQEAQLQPEDLSLTELLGIDGGDQGPGFIFPPSNNEGALSAARTVSQQTEEMRHRVPRGLVMLCVLRAYTDGRMEDITAETRIYILRIDEAGANWNHQRAQDRVQRNVPADQIIGGGDGPQ